jgi:hypothetical protein
MGVHLAEIMIRYERFSMVLFCRICCISLLADLFRRTLQDKIFGRPLVDLKEPHNHLWKLHFTAEERILYRAVEQRFREMINEWFADGDKKKNLTYFVLQLTRLRQ